MVLRQHPDARSPALTEFGTQHWNRKNRPATAKETKHVLNKHVLPAFRRTFVVPQMRHFCPAANSRNTASLTNSCLYSMAFALAKPLFGNRKTTVGDTASPIVLPGRPQ
jgi:hypothetical protein